MRIEKPYRVVNESGERVGAVMKKRSKKAEIYCFICERNVQSLQHYEKEH